MPSFEAKIDTHHHLLPDFYTEKMREHGLTQSGSMPLPAWSPEISLESMEAIGTGFSVLSLSYPGATFLPSSKADTLIKQVNDYAADVVASYPEKFGFFAALAVPGSAASLIEAERALNDLGADGIVLLPNSQGIYLGSQPEHEELFRLLNERDGVVFIHPGALPGTSVSGIPEFATDFLLDTTRAAYLLVLNEYFYKFPRVRIILSHFGGFVPFAAYRLAFSMLITKGLDPDTVVSEFAKFYFDTAISSSKSALPTALEFMHPERIVFGSDFPFVPTRGGQYFSDQLSEHVSDAELLNKIHYQNALALFPRLQSLYQK